MENKPIMFIDNTKGCWTGDMDMYAKSIHYIRVPNSSRKIEPRYTKHLANSGNQYANAILRSSSRNFINRGIGKNIADQLKEWSYLPESTYALFDWDGTISACEGFSLHVFQAQSNPLQFRSYMMDFLLPNHTRNAVTNRQRRKTRKHFSVKDRNPKSFATTPLVIPSKEFLDDMFVYLMRPERVEMLRDLFRTLLSNGVEVHVFTHNPYASTTNPYRKIFVEMMWRLLHSDSSQPISREEVDGMIHSTIDYTKPGELSLKRNIFERFSTD